jgi:hypothetical protein
MEKSHSLLYKEPAVPVVKNKLEFVPSSRNLVSGSTL